MPFPSDTSPDVELFDMIDAETQRQVTGLQLIASENFTSPEVMRAVGSVLTNKYAEGYPGKRYYGGNAVIDEVESLAIDRVTRLFGADHANVQPHSGANANMCAYQALLDIGDTVLGLSLDHGGHLTHGSPVNASGKLYHFVPYKVTPGDERIDMDQVRDLALEHRPKMIVAGTDQLPAAARPRAVQGDRRRDRGVLLVRRRPPGRPDRRWCPSQSRAVRRHRHLHDAQDAPRAARWVHPLQGRARHGGRQGGVPRLAGRPAAARDRRQGRCLPRGAAAELSRRMPSRSCSTPARWPKGWPTKGSGWSAAVPTAI